MLNTLKLHRGRNEAHKRKLQRHLISQKMILKLYGKYKAKLSDSLISSVQNNKDGKLVLVTAINPTPAGEGKTTITLDLVKQWAFWKKSRACIREPSLGPCFGIKGGAAGGGYAQVVPMEDLNLHFTGDFHAITSANNLLLPLCWITIFIRAMRFESIQIRLYGNVVWI